MFFSTGVVCMAGKRSDILSATPPPPRLLRFAAHEVASPRLPSFRRVALGVLILIEIWLRHIDSSTSATDIRAPRSIPSFTLLLSSRRFYFARGALPAGFAAAARGCGASEGAGFTTRSPFLPGAQQDCVCSVPRRVGVQESV